MNAGCPGQPVCTSGTQLVRSGRPGTRHPREGLLRVNKCPGLEWRPLEQEYDSLGVVTRKKAEQ